MADEPGTKRDQPSDLQGQGPAEKVQQEAAESKAAETTEAAIEQAEAKPKKARAPRKPKTPKAEATAAEATGVGKEEAEAAEKAPSGQRANPAARTRARDKAERGRARSGAGASGERVLVRANAKYVRTSARKARLVCDHIRGKSVEEAFAILAHTPRHVAEDWRKLLQSAVANAEHNHELLGDDLRIESVKADEGPTLKRFRPRAMGRATKIRKRTSHLTITLTPKD
jgi:ribosomal protein L22